MIKLACTIHTLYCHSIQRGNFDGKVKKNLTTNEINFQMNDNHSVCLYHVDVQTQITNVTWQ